MAAHHHAVTLVELLVVVGIITVLAGLLIPAASFIRQRGKALEAAQTVGGLHVAFDAYRLHTGALPAPDLPEDPGRPLAGHLAASADPATPGVLDRLRGRELFTWDPARLDPQGRLLDPWGRPYRYVRGDFANREQALDPARPQDLNKPLHGDQPAAESDWNSDDLGGFPYVWSEGRARGSEDWIYHSDGEFPDA